MGPGWGGASVLDLLVLSTPFFSEVVHLFFRKYSFGVGVNSGQLREQRAVACTRRVRACYLLCVLSDWYSYTVTTPTALQYVTRLARILPSRTGIQVDYITLYWSYPECFQLYSSTVPYNGGIAR